ncbi:MAG TPA: hypothetical protein DCE42_30100, partial [Myxococcales bacterium]|nr:hypothetical protein [Myxococcales bacterium]
MINQYNLRWSTWTLLLLFSLTLWQCGTSPCKADKDCDVTQRCVAFSCQIDHCRPLKLEQKIQWSAERVPQTPWTLRITATLQDTDLQWRFAPTVQKATEGWDIQSTQFDPKSVPSQLVIIAYSKKQWEQPIQLSIQSDVYPHNQQEQDEIKCPSSWTSPPIQVACPKDTTDCDGLCTSTQQNNEHCGSCGVVCANNTTCCAGVCVQLSNDTQHCGRCGQTCTAGDACCSGQCTSTRNNPAHCGACFQSCGGKTCCDSQCVETQSSRKHCGGCGQVCSGNCRVGVCFQCQRSSECSAGERCRYGQCVPCDTNNPCDTFLYLTNTLQSSNIALDKTGNIYIAGRFENQLKAGQTLLNSQGDKDLYFGKISPTGRWLWAYGAGSPGQELAAYITLDSQGSVYLTGHYGRNANGKPLQLQYNSTSPKTLPLPNNSNDTVFLAKFSSEGQNQWIKRLFGGINHWGNKAHTLPTGASRIAMTPQDTASTKGIFCDFDNLFNGKDPLDTNGQMAIIALDTQGKCQWGRLAGTFNGHDSSELLSVDEKGHTYWGGVITGPSNFGSFSPIHYDKEDIALA